MTMPLDRREFLQMSAAIAGTAAHGSSREAVTTSNRPERSALGSMECDAFCDLQVNGFAGIDFNDPATDESRFQEAAAAIERTGVTRFLATLISAPLDRFAACAKVLT